MVVCNDGNACTTDRCNPLSGACESTFDVMCDDALDCTADSCDPATGQCGYVADDEQCEDGDPCTRDECGGFGCRYTNICGACCSDIGQCVDGLFASECAGSYRGTGSTCAGDADFNGLDDLCEPSELPAVSEWGVAILSLLLLVGLSLKFSRQPSQASTR